jgi:hypothetical protein
MRRILAQARVEALAVALRVEAAAAVAEADVELAVGAEGDVAAVVVGEGLADGEDLEGRRGVGRAGVGGAVLDDVRVAAGVGVVDEEAAVRGVVGVEGHAQQALLVAGRHEGVDVEEVTGARAVLDDGDAAALFGHEEAALARRHLDGDRLPQAGGDDLGLEVDVGGQAGRRATRCRHDQHQPPHRG